MEKLLPGVTFRVKVLIDGVSANIYRRPRDNQAFIQAEPGQQFELELTNTSSGRLEIVTSVDGRDTLQEQIASIRNRGMVVPSHDQWRVTGWRLTPEKTAAFVFSPLSDSVERMTTGANENAGVIGFAAFREMPSPVGYAFRGDLEITRGGADSYGGQSVTKGDVGTGMGHVISDKVGLTTFKRDSASPVEMLTIQYRTRAWLERFGIIVPEDPDAFPGSPRGVTGYSRLLSERK